MKRTTTRTRELEDLYRLSEDLIVQLKRLLILAENNMRTFRLLKVGRTGAVITEAVPAKSLSIPEAVFLDNGRDYCEPLKANASHQELREAMRALKARRKFSRTKPSDYRVR